MLCITFLVKKSNGQVDSIHFFVFAIHQKRTTLMVSFTCSLAEKTRQMKMDDKAWNYIRKGLPWVIQLQGFNNNDPNEFQSSSRTQNQFVHNKALQMNEGLY